MRSSAKPGSKENPLKGKALQIIHVLNDYLWMKGSKKDPETLFLNEVPPSESHQADLGDDSANEEGEEEDEFDALDVETLGKKEKEKEKGKRRAEVQAREESEPDAGLEDQQDNEVTEQEMDELFEHAFIHSLKELVKDSDLPLLASTFFSAYMKELHPKGITLDLKKTSFKKVPFFFFALKSFFFFFFSKKRERSNSVY